MGKPEHGSYQIDLRDAASLRKSQCKFQMHFSIKRNICTQEYRRGTREWAEEFISLP
jgi:hypothetical protein